MPESGGFGGVYEGLLKFALIRFFDGSGLLLAGKTALALGVVVRNANRHILFIKSFVPHLSPLYF